LAAGADPELHAGAGVLGYLCEMALQGQRAALLDVAPQVGLAQRAEWIHAAPSRAWGTPFVT